MWSRGRLDVSLTHFAAAFTFLMLPGNRNRVGLSLRKFSKTGTAIPCLSVRSAVDTLFGLSKYSPDDEILFSAITVPAMLQIVEAHGLVAVGLELQTDSAFPTVDECRQKITQRTRAIVLAPLFGAQVILKPYRELADEFGLMLIEDAAQAFDGQYRGCEHAHVSLFSFGPIKRSTAFGGGLAVFQSPLLAKQFADAQSALPKQSRLQFLTRAAKLLVLHMLSGRIPYAILYRTMARLSKYPDAAIANSAKGFPSDRLLKGIRQQPCTPLLRLLNRRIQSAKLDQVFGHSLRFQSAMETQVPDSVISFGRNNDVHHYWLCPFIVDNAAAVAAAIRSQGFDATTSHRLAIVGHQTSKVENTNALLESILFLPCYPKMDDNAVKQMMTAFRNAVQEHSNGAS